MGDRVLGSAGDGLPRADAVSPLQGRPQLQTIAFTALAGIIYFTLNWGTGAQSLASTEEWAVWRIVAALGVTISTGVGIIGYRLFRRSADAPRSAMLANLASALLFVGLIVWFLQSGASIVERSWPIPGMQWRQCAVIVAVGLATVPWVALTWQVHVSASDRRAASSLRDLLRLWAMLRACVMAFAGFVVIALVQTGALRSVWQAQPGLSTTQQEEFTTTDVLLYGGFLALMMAGLVIPLLAAWKVQAELLVQERYPLHHLDDGLRDKAWFEGRDRLAKFLHLDVGVLRNPLTALSVLTPLVTAMLAAFLPELTAKH